MVQDHRGRPVDYTKLEAFQKRVHVPGVNWQWYIYVSQTKQPRSLVGQVNLLWQMTEA